MLETPQTPKAAMFLKPPKNQRNIEKRSREYLSNNEIAALRKAARTQGRNTVRDDALILLMFRHALRVSEVVALRWEQVDLKESLLHVRRLKNGTPSTHPLHGVELRLLRQLERESAGSPYVFTSERKAPLSARAVHNIVARAGVRADFDFTAWFKNRPFLETSGMAKPTAIAV